jgi:hypothetical protein
MLLATAFPREVCLLSRVVHLREEDIDGGVLVAIDLSKAAVGYSV